MRYGIEELIPIVGRLAERLTAFESSSISYGKARQLMGAVCYCIQEAEQAYANPLVPSEGLSAIQAYEAGAAAVREKACAAAALYNEVLQTFDSYGSLCLYDTFIKGMPEFFKRYDAEFAPQETILALDYPVLRDLSAETGIDKIYAFLECIRLEQGFLAGFPEGAVEELLSQYGQCCGMSAEELVENICEMVLAVSLKNGERDFLEWIPPEYRDYLAPSLQNITIRRERLTPACETGGF